MAAKTARSEVILLKIFTIILAQVWTEAQENALNAPQVLLPYTPTDAVPANYTLKAVRGCFRWSSSKPEVAMVMPLYNFDPIACQGYSLGEKTGEDINKKCSTSATITASSTSKEKETAVVIAEEESSGILLRCDVFVDTIHRIEIATTTRELLLGESPEVFDVYGYDEEGNLFSSLGSTVFDWYLSPVPVNDTVDPSTVLRFLQFEGSSYETTQEIHSLEQKGQRGSSVIMMGINTGEALVSAKLVHPAYKDVAPSTVRLMVVDNIILQPSLDVYILVGTKVEYKVKQLRRGHQKEIAMPSPQYRFQLTKDDIATWNHEESSITGKAFGETKVLLIDNNVAHTKSVRQPSATVHVVEPGFLGFAISPGNVWVLETGREYTITVEIFDFKKHKILITDNTMLKSMFPEEHFELKFQSTNGSFHYVKAIKAGRRKINATLIGIQTEDGANILNIQPAISGEQIVDIFDPIRIEPNLVLFPCEAALAGGSLYTVQLKAFGGSGKYQWSSHQYSIATVTNKGLVKAGSVLGTVKIRARDLKNVEHYGEATIKVLPPDEMHFLPTPVEAEIGQSLALPLSVSAYVDIEGKKVLRVFEDCRRISLGKSLSDESVFIFTESQIEGSKLQANSCTIISLKAIKTGFTTLTVTYRADNVVLKASITVGAYEPLVVIDPADVATVTLGSSEIVALAGGPQPWILDPNGFYESLSAEEDEWVAIQKSDRHTRLASVITRNDIHLFKVTCRQITEIQLLTGQIGNKPTSTNQYPASSVTKLRFLCTPPGSLTLKPDIVLPVIDGHQMTLERCQDADKNIPVRNNRELTIFLVVRDASGQVFDNASSLDIKWSSSNTDLVKITQKHSQSVRVKGNFSASVSQTILLSSNTGPVTIEAAVSGYKEVDLYAIGIYDEGLKQQTKINPPISGSLGLHLVNERSLTPSQLTLFSHSKNTARLTISDGSRHFKVKVNDNSLADIQTLTSAIVVTPRSPGRLAVSVYDICLDSERPARADVKLADIHTIQVVVADKVELHKFIKAVVQIKDADGNSLSVNDMKLMNLTPKFSASIIESKLDHDSSDSKSAFSTKATYLLEGIAVGVTSLTFHAVQANAIKICSKPQDIQVFPPLRLDPRRIIMIVGSTFQVQSIGGPRPQSTVVFEITNQAVAKISNVGIITASTPGNTTITGVAQGTDPHSDTTIVYSQDIIFVEVLRLKGFKIRLPSRVIISGSQVGMYAVGLSDEGPFTFATAIPYLKFHWSITNNEVAVLKSVYDSTGVTVGNEKDFRVVLGTQSAGQATIKLRVEITASWIHEIVMPSAILEDEIQIQVFEGLRVLFPEDGEMLLPPNVETKIKTSKDGVARLSYEIAKGCSEDTKAAIIDLSPDGHIKTTSTSGIATVLIMSHEDFGFNQTAVINIEVRAVASITMVSLSSVIAFKNNWHSFPIGVNANFAVALHDNVGRKFDVSTIQLKHRVHRFDMITVVPDSNKAVYAIRAVEVGHAVLKVWDEHNPDVADYVRIHVAYGIEPSQATVQHGSMICFKSLVKTTTKDAPVTWSISNPEVLSIDASSGNGIAQSAGTAVVYYGVGELLTQVEVKVQKSTSLKLLSSESTILTNAAVYADKMHIDVPVKIGDDENTAVGLCDKIATDTKERRLPFTCRLISDGKEPVSIEEIFNVKAKYLNGRPFCEISPIELPSKVLQQISSTNIVLHLHSSLLDASQESAILTDTTYLRFIPAFVIAQRDVQLSSEKPSVLISVFGVAAQLNSLQVTSQDASRVQVLPIDSSSKETSVDYEIKLMTETDVLINTLSIIFKSGLTGQTATLKVLIESTPTAKPEHCVPTVVVPDAAITNTNYFRSTAKEYGPWIVLYTILIATIVLLIFIYHSFVNRRNQQNSFQPGSPYNPMMTPAPGSSASHTPGSVVRGQSTYRRSPHETTPGVRNLFSVGQ